MLYRLKTGNYQNFSVFAQNLCQPRAYFIPYGNEEKALSVNYREQRYSSDMVRCLSGQWDFRFFENPETLPDVFDTEKESFDSVPVPSCWQFTGYAKPFYLNVNYQFKANPPFIPTVKAEPYHVGVRQILPTDAYNNVGVYRKLFDVTDLNKTRKLAFLGVASCIDVFLNGYYIGYGEGSHNTKEFIIDSFVKEGQNELVCVVHRWCNGTYLEAQDMFRNNGIFRDVLLYETPKENINDFKVITEKTENGYNLKVIICVENPANGTVSLSLRTEGCKYTQSASSSKQVSFYFADLPVQEWSAENPVLYPMVLSLNGEFIRTEIGFKTIKIVNAVYYLNDQPIKMYGVNHHDSSPTGGFTMTAEELERDVRLMKEYNCNAVRTSHYPPDPVFLQYCAQYGLYVIDEADIETHGMGASHKGINGISNNLEWKEHYLDRVRRMYYRDRNNVAVCMWSLGNESGGIKCQDYCYSFLKGKESGIPVHYEGACRSKRKAYDIMSEMYTPISFMRRRLNRAVATHSKRYHPYFLCEYAHAMGVGPGSLQDYYNLFQMSKHFLGGCIWEWVDHAVLQKDGSYTYGGDHGEYIHDGNFCVDGLFYPDRTPSRSAIEMKNVYRPVYAQYSGKELHFKNNRYFTDTSDILFKIIVRADDEIYSDTTENFIIQPQKSIDYAIDFPHAENLDVTVYYIDKKTQNEIGFESLILKQEIPAFSAPKGTVTSTDNGNTVEILAGENRFVFDKISCTITTVEKDGTDYVNHAPCNRHKIVGSYTEIFRAPFDNDRNIQKIWRTQGVDTYTIKPKLIGIEKRNSCFVAHVHFRYKATRILATEIDRIAIYPDGSVTYDVFFTPWILPFFTRISKVFEWTPNLTDTEWFGFGPGESYPDLKAGTRLDTFHAKVSDAEPYIFPQHSGTRSGVRRSSVMTEDGKKGILFHAVKKPYYWTTLPYTERELDVWSHRKDVQPLPTTSTFVDGFFRGVGTNSCGPLPLWNYTLSGFVKYHYRFRFEPFGSPKA